MHRTNNFSNNAVLGGPHMPGNFHGHMRWQLEQQIARHIIDNFANVSRAIGVDRCKQLIRWIIPRRSIYKAVKDRPAVAALFGGPRLGFHVKYGAIYRILKKH
jgi:hypothetical protein